MKVLKDILTQIEHIKVHGNDMVEVTGITSDSRKVVEGNVFVAVRGTRFDGHEFIPLVAAKGAIVFGENPYNPSVEAVAYIQVQDARQAFAQLASIWFGHPSHRLKLIGITGTNGKTTVATLLFNAFKSMGKEVGLISTIDIRYGDITIDSKLTTPDALSLNKHLHAMVDHGIEYVFMEVSSHAIDQERIHGIKYFGGVFTNISHDHLDYHETFKSYIHTKKRFFDGLPREAFALTNDDDRNGLVMVQNTKATVKTYALKKPADYKGRILDNAVSGLHLEMNGAEIYARLVGEFNAANLLAAYGVGESCGIDNSELLKALSLAIGAEGRFDIIYAKDKNVMGIVDYAHTPDALKNVLETINRLKRSSGKVLTVFGCGGNRDKAKRPVMAKLAVSMSDQVIITSDNPRDENPKEIIQDIEAGVHPSDHAKVITIEDRTQAIKTACTMAREGDIILLAGKGHEKYQEIAGERFDFDDKKKLQAYLGIET